MVCMLLATMHAAGGRQQRTSCSARFPPLGRSTRSGEPLHVQHSVQGSTYMHPVSAAAPAEQLHACSCMGSRSLLAPPFKPSFFTLPPTCHGRSVIDVPLETPSVLRVTLAPLFPQVSCVLSRQSCVASMHALPVTRWG